MKQKKCIIVMGINNAGKSNYRKKYYINNKYIDIFEIQEKMNLVTKENIALSYETALEKVLDLLQTEDEIVFEHTLLKKIRRDVYIEKIKEKYPDIIIELICIVPTLSQYFNNCRRRWEDYNISYITMEEYTEQLFVLEIPKKNEDKRINTVKLLYSTNDNYF